MSSKDEFARTLAAVAIGLAVAAFVSGIGDAKRITALESIPPCACQPASPFLPMPTGPRVR